jgi:hypothetical protein
VVVFIILCLVDFQIAIVLVELSIMSNLTEILDGKWSTSSQADVIVSKCKMRCKCAHQNETIQHHHIFCALLALHLCQCLTVLQDSCKTAFLLK